MTNLMKFMLAGLAAFALLHLASPVASAEDLQTALTGTDLQPDATGLASYRVNGGRGRGLEITVEAVDITDTVLVLINEVFVAQIFLVDTRGGAGLETGRGDDVPDIQAGDLIEITDGDGNVLLWGVF